MRDTKIETQVPPPARSRSSWRIIILSILLIVAIGMLLKNKKENAPAPGSNTESRSGGGIPPDSLHH